MGAGRTLIDAQRKVDVGPILSNKGASMLLVQLAEKGAASFRKKANSFVIYQKKVWEEGRRSWSWARVAFDSNFLLLPSCRRGQHC